MTLNFVVKDFQCKYCTSILIEGSISKVWKLLECKYLEVGENKKNCSFPPLLLESIVPVQFFALIFSSLVYLMKILDSPYRSSRLGVAIHIFNSGQSLKMTEGHQIALNVEEVRLVSALQKKTACYISKTWSVDGGHILEFFFFFRPAFTSLWILTLQLFVKCYEFLISVVLNIFFFFLGGLLR